MVDAPSVKKPETPLKQEGVLESTELKMEVDREVVAETQKEGQEQVQEKQDTSAQAESTPFSSQTLPPQPIKIQKDPVLEEIEEILAEDLTDIFLGLPESKRPAFKKKGEETAIKLWSLVHDGKAKVKTVLQIIKEWLKMVPGINKFFLEQESKIKADKLMMKIDKMTSAMSENEI